MLFKNQNPQNSCVIVVGNSTDVATTVATTLATSTVPSLLESSTAGVSGFITQETMDNISFLPVVRLSTLYTEYTLRCSSNKTHLHTRVLNVNLAGHR